MITEGGMDSGMVTGPARVEVGVQDDTSEGVDDPDHWSEVARLTLLGEGVVAGRLDVLFVDADEMAMLNEQHLGGTGTTDVLAFPLDGPETAADAAAGVPVPVQLGDVVVCPSVARAQAPGHTGSYEPELTLLVIHGVLHVLGHDHAEPVETRAMQDRERHYLRRYGYAHPVAP